MILYSNPHTRTYHDTYINCETLGIKVNGKIAPFLEPLGGGGLPARAYG
jgi:hypothetical protein